jgi:hypothetical protein
MFNKQKESRNKMDKQSKKVIKVLSREAKRRGMVSRLDKIKEMFNGLTALNLVVLRQRRDGHFGFCSFETLDIVNKILTSAKQSRLNPRRVFKQLEFNY